MFPAIISPCLPDELTSQTRVVGYWTMVSKPLLPLAGEGLASGGSSQPRDINGLDGFKHAQTYGVVIVLDS